MEIAYYNLSGGINQALTKTELGIDTNRMYWTDSENVEILHNRGITKQKGNTLFLQLDDEEKITGMFEMPDNTGLVITTVSGKIYIEDNGVQTLLDKTLTGQKPYFAGFLNGVLVITESDGLFYIKNNSSYDVVECGLDGPDGSPVTGSVLTVYKGRVWAAAGSRIYYSALGTYDDFTSENDAGYINDFHTDTGVITAMKPYKDYLAIYKKHSVYLLTGVSPEDFAVTPFADKGTEAPNAITNVDNKQYFLGSGIYALEQVGELNQIRLGSEISLKIKPEFGKFDKVNLKNSICLHYEDKSRIWYFIAYPSDNYFHTIWINDYLNKAWYKRVVPQNIVTACIYNGFILTADTQGRIYREDFGTTFCGEAVEFMWKSPFLSVGVSHHRKTIDEFYFLLDEEYDNDFDFSVFKDYDETFSDDTERISSVHPDHLIWADEGTSEEKPCRWTPDNKEVPVWSINRDTMEKAEISEASYSIQLCVSGGRITQSCAIIGLQFREIYNDD
ncbi:MAG: hypothetical protein LBK53_08115 [Heliobacteriaceae bacterium]|jgi:hypothetical protein|nr:hypothetical protein [Heliobacteriaceae bacterium]